MHQGIFSVTTSRKMELIDITSLVAGEVEKAGLVTGICYLYNPHTTAALTINEGADPDVRRDIIDGLREIVPLDYPFKHLEGNSPAHIMTTLTGSSETVFIDNGTLVLGTWQAIFFCEYDGPRRRKVHFRIV